MTSWPCWSTAWPWRSGTGSVLRALLDEGVLLLRDALVCSAGTLRESDPRWREAAERAARALSPGDSPRRWACWSGRAPPAAPMWGPGTWPAGWGGTEHPMTGRARPRPYT
ncbi:MAG: hypothetical protein ACLRNQ_18025 [Flavonifractor plautii]